MADQKYNGTWLCPDELDLLRLVYAEPFISEEEIMSQRQIDQERLRALVQSIEKVFGTLLVGAAILANKAGIL